MRLFVDAWPWQRLIRLPFAAQPALAAKVYIMTFSVQRFRQHVFGPEYWQGIGSMVRLVEDMWALLKNREFMNDHLVNGCQSFTFFADLGLVDRDGGMHRGRPRRPRRHHFLPRCSCGMWKTLSRGETFQNSDRSPIPTPVHDQDLSGQIDS